jgi:aryl-alcohol dehydrogenase-like predicted oxidoreductase
LILEKRQLGSTDIKVSLFCVGCWGFGGDSYWGAQVRDEALLRANLGALLKARQKGTIREIGVSNFSLATLKIVKEKRRVK